jgi:hypothetical protein
MSEGDDVVQNVITEIRPSVNVSDEGGQKQRANLQL